MGGKKSGEDAWKQLHDEACAREEDRYVDPRTGFTVFTSIHHVKRGFCCESGCRHCPFGFVVEDKRKGRT